MLLGMLEVYVGLGKVKEQQQQQNILTPISDYGSFEPEIGFCFRKSVHVSCDYIPNFSL